MTTTTLRHLPGKGVLARYGDLTLLCEAAPAQHERVGVLIDAVADAAASSEGVRRLSRRLAGLVVEHGLDADFPSLCAFGPSGDGVAVLVHGDAELAVTVAGREMRLTGHEAVTVLDRVITEPVESIRAMIGDGLAEPGADRWSRLDAGVVRADALVFGPELDVVEAEPSPEPSPEPVAGGDPQVLGVYCKKTHFNDPSVAYCSVCGISMAQSTKVPEWGNRPSLGVMVLDDGTTYPLDCDQVIGRMPELDAAVAAGTASPLSLRDPMVSRVHARILLRDWMVTVIDAGSANGTFVMSRHDSSWTRCEPESETTLSPGAIVSVGRRQLRYYSHRNQ
jgi:hypothetical protein